MEGEFKHEKGHRGEDEPRKDGLSENEVVEVCAPCNEETPLALLAVLLREERAVDRAQVAFAGWRIDRVSVE